MESPSIKPLKDNPMPKTPPPEVIAVEVRSKPRRRRGTLAAYLSRSSSRETEKMCRDAFSQFHPGTEPPPLKDPFGNDWGGR